MAKKYLANVRVDAVKALLFNSLSVPRKTLHEVVKLTSGENLPKAQINGGEYSVYGGGGLTDGLHTHYNVTGKTIGIGRVGARCGCVFVIKEKSWVTDNALYATHIDEAFELEFLVRYLNFAQLNQYANTAAQPVISLKRIASVSVPLLNREQQLEFISILDAVEGGSVFIEDDKYGVNDLLKTVEILEDTQVEFDQQLTYLTQLRQALLREAMQGQLLPQDPTDEPAAVLLQRLQAVKAASGKGGKGKAGALFAEEVEAVEGPFGIPESWVWARLGDVTKFIDYRGKTPTKTESGVKLITAKNVKRGYFSEHPQEFISEADVKTHMTRGWPIKGDVLFTTEAPLGNACLLNEEPPFALAQRIITLQPSTILLNTFLLQAMLSEGVQTQLQEKASGATAQGIKSSRLVNVLIPLPPLAEQHRIVAKLEQLLQHCDALEQRIRESRRLAEQLLQTALREALAPPAGVEEEEAELVEGAPEAAAPRRRGRPAKKEFQSGDYMEFGDLFSQQN